MNTIKPQQGAVMSVVFSADGKKLIASTSHGRLLLWDLTKLLPQTK